MSIDISLEQLSQLRDQIDKSFLALYHSNDYIKLTTEERARVASQRTIEILAVILECVKESSNEETIPIGNK